MSDPPAPPRTGAAAIEAALATMPFSPGVYRMLDAKGDALYVGKARSLKKRVAAYTQLGRLDERLRRMVNETAAMEVDHHPHRGRGAAARGQPDQAPEAALQHRAARRQVLPVADADRGPSVPADRQASRRAGAQGQLLGAVRLRLGGEPDGHRDAAGVPAALLRRHGVRQPHAALPAVPDPPLLGALRRPDQRGGLRPAGRPGEGVPRRQAGHRAAGARRRDGAGRRARWNSSAPPRCATASAR